jgi:hypothetical protein
LPPPTASGSTSSTIASSVPAPNYGPILPPGPITHQLTYGGDASVTRQEGLRSGTLPTPPDVFPTRAFPITDYWLAGGYVANQIGIGRDRLTLYPTLRFDYYSLTPKREGLLPASFATASQHGSRLSPSWAQCSSSAARQVFCQLRARLQGAVAEPGQPVLRKPDLASVRVQDHPQPEPEARNQSQLRRRLATARRQHRRRGHRLHRPLPQLHRSGDHRWTRIGCRSIILSCNIYWW